MAFQQILFLLILVGGLYLFVSERLSNVRLRAGDLLVLWGAPRASTSWPRTVDS